MLTTLVPSSDEENESDAKIVRNIEDIDAELPMASFDITLKGLSNGLNVLYLYFLTNYPSF